jgi:hypothetical protein
MKVAVDVIVAGRRLVPQTLERRSTSNVPVLEIPPPMAFHTGSLNEPETLSSLVEAELPEMCVP